MKIPKVFILYFLIYARIQLAESMVFILIVFRIQLLVVK
jgi:hypothetical protein